MDVECGFQMRTVKAVRRVLLISVVLGVAAFAFRGILRRPAAAVVQRVSELRTDAQSNQPAADPWRKIEIDLQSLAPDGLRGPADGKVAISYEFAIPNTEECKAQVRTLDPTVQFMPGSQGRIRAPQTGCLCIGSTHQPGYRDVLRKLAELRYVERIVECYFE